jgi:hypothetical protein
MGIWWAACLFAAVAAIGQNAPAAPEPNSGSEIAPSTNVFPPTPPVVKSPVELFRELLAASGAERKQLLADRSIESRQRIVAKVREYESLKPDEREIRLQVTELRYYLRPLMGQTSTERFDALRAIPDEKRALLESRLQEWDLLPESVRRELLDNEAAIAYFTEIESATEEQRRRTLENMSPARRQKLEMGLVYWRQMPEGQRRTILSRFNRFFELTPGERQRALATLSEAERQQIEKTLHAFGSLPSAQRAQCIRSFEKFASLSLEDRQLFLKNAEKWKVMTPEQRQSWRDLVSKLNIPPPLPPTGSIPPLPRNKKPGAQQLPPPP